MNGKSLSALRQKLRKYIRENLEQEIAKFRENPDGDDEEEEEEGKEEVSESTPQETPDREVDYCVLFCCGNSRVTQWEHFRNLLVIVWISVQYLIFS